jgi:hypothetical protein
MTFKERVIKEEWLSYNSHGQRLAPECGTEVIFLMNEVTLEQVFYLSSSIFSC